MEWKRAYEARVLLDDINKLECEITELRKCIEGVLFRDDGIEVKIGRTEIKAIIEDKKEKIKSHEARIEKL